MLTHSTPDRSVDFMISVSRMARASMVGTEVTQVTPNRLIERIYSLTSKRGNSTSDAFM